MNTDNRYLSATQISKERAVPIAEVFKQLIALNYINPVEGPKKWELTPRGFEAGGRYQESLELGTYIQWPAKLSLEITGETATINPMSQTNDSINAKADTEGEDFIKEFLDEVGLKYEYQVPIRGLVNDSKSIRVADFYLPKYAIYIEFLGHWNTHISYRESYKEKERVYKQNRIPCIFIYPENLGTLHFSFDRRITKALKEASQHKTLNSYNTWKFRNAADLNFLGILFSLSWIIYFFIAEPKDTAGKLIGFFILVYNIYKVFRIWKQIFVKENYSLYKMINE
jgi:hypothetical protein